MIVRPLLSKYWTTRATIRLSRQFRQCLTTEVGQVESAVLNAAKETRSLDAIATDVLDTPIIPESQSSNNEATVQSYLTLREHKRATDGYGSTLTPYYQPHTLISNPPRPADVTLELLMASQSHLGHSTSLWNPANSRYIFGIRDGIHIISLDVTAAHLRRAAKVVSAVTERGGLVLFAGTRPGQNRCVVRAAELSGGCHLFEKWVPGSITNGQQILGDCQLKVVNKHDVEIEGLDEQLRDRAALKPDLVVCLNPIENYVLLHECGLHNIPTIGIIDTDANPAWVTYPIPANDDSLRCVQVITGVLGRAGEEGRLRRLEAAKHGHKTYRPMDLDLDFTAPKAEEQESEFAQNLAIADNPVQALIDKLSNAESSRSTS